jgi:hypothetical protein
MVWVAGTSKDSRFLAAIAIRKILDYNTSGIIANN